MTAKNPGFESRLLEKNMQNVKLLATPVAGEADVNQHFYVFFLSFLLEAAVPFLRQFALQCHLIKAPIREVP